MQTHITLKVRCPRCMHFMNYQPKAGDISVKTKRCVYCGAIFKVHGATQETDRIHQVLA